MTSQPPAPRRWWREPLIHFLAIGALLFLVFHWRGGSGSSRIVITPGQIDALGAAFTRTWQRPPTEQELKGQVDEYVREEIATREAMNLGLDRDDTVIRRRLRQKLEFLAEDTLDAAPPSDAELQAWLDAHPESFRVDPEVAFRQVYFNPERRGASIEGDVRRVREQLSREKPDVALDALGDSLMLPVDVAQATRTDLAQQFGHEFADAVVNLEVGRWAGPVRSGYGVHLVFVRERQDGRVLSLAEVRTQVERDFTADRRRRQLEAMYEGFLGRYRVCVETRTGEPTAAAASPGAAGAAK
jgi:hypothetical protein